MQVKGVLHTTPFKNRVADSVWVVKFSEGVEGCTKVSCCELAAVYQYFSRENFKLGVLLQAFCKYYLYFK